jgi:predicted kinase
MKALILVRGCPGAGKTEFARTMGRGPLVSADDYFMKNGFYDFDKTKLGAAHKYCQTETAAYMYEGKGCIFVANTFTTKSEMQPYYDLAKKYGYRVYSIIVEKRHGNTSIHSVPEAAIEEMIRRFDIKL